MNQPLEILTHLGMKAGSWEELLDRISKELLAMGYVEPTFRQAIKEREKIYPTGLRTTSIGVAIPHTDVEHVKKNAVLAVTLDRPVAFREMGGGREDHVDVECVLMILLNSADRQVKLLMGLMNIVRDPAELGALRQAQDSQTVVRLLQKHLGGVMEQGGNSDG